jgi:hypothetical protein
VERLIPHLKDAAELPGDSPLTTNQNREKVDLSVLTQEEFDQLVRLSMKIWGLEAGSLEAGSDDGPALDSAKTDRSRAACLRGREPLKRMARSRPVNPLQARTEIRTLVWPTIIQNGSVAGGNQLPHAPFFRHGLRLGKPCDRFLLVEYESVLQP